MVNQPYVFSCESIVMGIFYTQLSLCTQTSVNQYVYAW